MDGTGREDQKRGDYKTELLAQAGAGWKEHQPELADADCPNCGEGCSGPHYVVVCADCRDDWPCYHIRAYQAGREDLLRSGSCPECAAGDPHDEPDKPHIHLTTYGYLLYAPDHEQLDFVREIREIERRAGREDAAREKDQKRSTERSWIFPIDSKADVLFTDGKHRYWSTHCRHGNHDACSATVIEGVDVHEDMLAYLARKPAQCKSCSSPCLCTCHKDQPAGGVQPTEEQPDE